MDDLPKIFQDVIDKGKFSPRYEFGTPWSDEQYVYATDGIVAVRLKASPELLAAYRRPKGGPQGLKVAGLGFDDDYEPEPLELPTELVDVAIAEPVTEKCWRCVGEREVECLECGNVDECPECDGNGTITDEPPELPPVKFSGHMLRAKIVRMLQDHRATVYLVKGHNGQVLRFTCGDVEGLAMTISQPKC